MPEKNPSTKKRVLIIAHAFPPSGGAAVRRIIKMVKYLDQFGWEISVLAPRRGEHFAYAYDPALCQQVPPAVTVYPSFTPEMLLMTRTVATSTGGASSPASASAQKFSWGQLYRRIYKGAGRMISIPESAITWLPFAVWSGLRIIRRHPVDVILATAPPYSTLLVAGALKRLTGLPFVAEFRDAWTADAGRGVEDPWRQGIERRQEAWAIHQANRVVSVTAGVTQDFAQRFPGPDPVGKYQTIPNGFDRDDFSFSAPAPAGQKQTFNIVYTGTLGGVRTPKYFLQAVHDLLQQQPELGRKLRITFVGLCGPFMDGRTLPEYIQEYGLQEIVTATGFVSRAESLRYQAEADLLLLLVGCVPEENSATYGLSGKIFDYLLAGKPVLTLAETGPTADLAAEAQVGEVVSHFDHEGILRALDRALNGQMAYRPNLQAMERYDFKNLAAQLEAVLLQCMDARQAKKT